MIAALYVDPRGPYPRMPNVDAWDETRDARTYEGPHAVVAHPPCGPWGALRHLYKGDEHDCGPRAVEQVRRWGGVLEHPAHSKLWAACGMPNPGELPDAYGGVTIQVEQVRWGHVALKPTWIYLVRIRDVPADPPARRPTHWIGGSRGKGRTRQGSPIPHGMKAASAQQRRRTPAAFADWLVQLAESVS